MIHPLRMHYDKLLLVLAIAVLGGSLDWVRRQQDGLRLLRAEAVNPRLAAAIFEPAVRNAPPENVAVWPEPRDQSHGAGWRYEVFTPPMIRHDAATRTFGLVPIEPTNAELAAKSSATEPLAAEPDVFRLQLIGYFGGADDYLVAFRSSQTADTLLARVGHRFADLGLTFRFFEVRKVLVEENDSGPVYEVAALATLLDERSNREVVLDSRMRPFADPATAQTAAGSEPLPQLEARRVASNSRESLP